jgi:hypothetical protein
MRNTLSAVKFALFGMLTMCLMMATEDSPAADPSAITNPVHDGILARVEAALKSGAVWIEDHLHALLDNIETSLGGAVPPADPTPEQTAAAIAADPSIPEVTDKVGAGNGADTTGDSSEKSEQVDPAGTAEHAAETSGTTDASPASSEPEQAAQ